MLHNIFKISLCVSLPYLAGVAARAWWEIKLFLVFIFGFIFLGIFLLPAAFGQELTIGQNVQNILTYIVVFTPIGYITSASILKYIDARLERFWTSDAFDPTYRKYAKRHKTAFANDDIDAFHDFFQAYQEETRADPHSSYQDYSQYRQSQSDPEGAAFPPPQDYRSNKDKMLDILEVSDRNASAKDLKSAYRKLAWKYHPDVLAKNELSDTEVDEAEARMQDINQAYDWLKENGFAD